MKSYLFQPEAILSFADYNSQVITSKVKKTQTKSKRAQGRG